MSRNAAPHVLESPPADADDTTDAVFVRLSRDELERELLEVESALAKARANLELARVDVSRWALLLERAEGLARAIPEGTPDGKLALEEARAEQREILRMQKGAHLRFAGCTSTIEALVRVEHTVRARLARAIEPPRTSGILRRVGGRTASWDDPTAS